MNLVFIAVCTLFVLYIVYVELRMSKLERQTAWLIQTIDDMKAKYEKCDTSTDSCRCNHNYNNTIPNIDTSNKDTPFKVPTNNNDNSNNVNDDSIQLDWAYNSNVMIIHFQVVVLIDRKSDHESESQESNDPETDEIVSVTIPVKGCDTTSHKSIERLTKPSIEAFENKHYVLHSEQDFRNKLTQCLKTFKKFSNDKTTYCHNFEGPVSVDKSHVEKWYSATIDVEWYSNYDGVDDE